MGEWSPVRIRRMDPKAVLPGIRRVDLEPHLMGKRPRVCQQLSTTKQLKLQDQMTPSFGPASISLTLPIEMCVPKVVPALIQCEVVDAALQRAVVAPGVSKLLARLVRLSFGFSAHTRWPEPSFGGNDHVLWTEGANYRFL